MYTRWLLWKARVLGFPLLLKGKIFVGVMGGGNGRQGSISSHHLKQTKLQLKIFQTWPWFEICKRQIENPVKVIKIRQIIFLVLEKFEKAKIWAVTALPPLTGISSRDSG